MTPAVGDDGATGVGVREDGGETLDSEALATGGSEGFPLVRQQSLLSLTLDEFQNAVRGPGKSFGSMNMDEFLTNIWNTEEGNVAGAGNDEGELPARQKDLLSVPAPLSRKTVEEVWSDIHWDRREPPPAMAPPPGNTQDMGRSQRQPTFGEMTLEDFLVKAGVVREGGHLPCSSPLPLKQLPLHTQQLHQHQQNGYGLPGGYQTASGHHPEYGHVGGEENTGAADRSYRNYHPRQVLQPGGAGNSYGGSGGERTGNGHAVAASPLSPASSESLDRSNPKSGPWDSGGPRRGGGGGSAPWGRKRVLDGSTEKVVERRQRRMMKNRESAARSRARKQVTCSPPAAQRPPRRP